MSAGRPTAADGRRAGVPRRLPRRLEPRLIDRALCVGFLALAVVDYISGAGRDGLPG